MATLTTTTIDGSINEKSNTVSKNSITTTTPQIGSDVYYDTTTHNSLSTTVYNIAEGKIVHFYRDDTDNGLGKAVVGTMTAGNEDNIIWGAPVTFSGAATSPAAGNNPSVGICAANLNGSSKVVIAWAEGNPASGMPSAAHKGTSKVGTISGTGSSATISFGSETLFEAANYTLGGNWEIDSKHMCSDTTGNRVVLAWKGYGPTYTAPFTLSCVKNGTTTVTTASTAALTVGKDVSGTGITALTHIVSITNSTTFELSRAATDSATSTLTFTDRKIGWASVGTVSGTTVTWNTPAIFEHIQDQYNNHPSIQFLGTCYNATAQKFVVAYKNRYGDGSTTHTAVCKVGTLQGDHSIIFGSTIVRATSGVEGHTLIYDEASGKTIHVSEDVSGSAGNSVACGVHSGTDATATIAFGTDVNFTGGVTGFNIQGVYDSSAEQNLLFWKNTSAPYYWHLKSAKVSGTTMTLGTTVTGAIDGGTWSDFSGIAYDSVAKKSILTPTDDNGPFGFGMIAHFNVDNITIDLATGNFFEFDNIEYNIKQITVSNVPADYVSSFVLKLTQAYDPKDFLWSELSAFKWIGGTAPTLTTVNDKIDTLSFTTYDNGTTWYASVVGQNYPHVTNTDTLFGARGVWAGGSHGGGNETRIDYITIATPGNATIFGDLTAGHNRNIAGTSNGSRGVFGGQYGSVTTIDYITIATTGNATDFGDLSQGRGTMEATSDGVRGIFAGGTTGSNAGDRVNTIDYITIATTGNATDFGDLTNAVEGAGSASDGSRGLFAVGSGNPSSTTIDYITIATPGNGIVFGNMLETRRHLGGASDGSRAVFGGGFATTPTHKNLEYVTISTTSNSTLFGELTQASQITQIAATSNGPRGVWGGGYVSDTIAYITIATTGNATDFGDLTIGRSGSGATSGD